MQGQNTNDQSFLSGTALITGGASGIGYALAEVIVARGGRVALIGTHRGRLDAALARLGASAGTAIGVELDVADGSRWERAADEVEERLGSISLLALNAGAQSRRTPLETLRWEEWRLAWDVNVHGVFNGVRAVLPRMKARAAPARILIVSSLGALIARPLAGAYDASKAASLAIGESLRGELASTPIRVSVLCPGPVRTDFAATAARHTPGTSADDFAFMHQALAAGLGPEDVANYAIDRMVAGDFYIFTHPELAAAVRQRIDGISAAIAASS